MLDTKGPKGSPVIQHTGGYSALSPDTQRLSCASQPRSGLEQIKRMGIQGQGNGRHKKQKPNKTELNTSFFLKIMLGREFVFVFKDQQVRVNRCRQ